MFYIQDIKHMPTTHGVCVQARDVGPYLESEQPGAAYFAQSRSRNTGTFRSEPKSEPEPSKRAVSATKEANAK